ncbi:hypothetical protein CIB95_04150 [Lottiidibacillus patelloidae]|uniref:DUF3887 domain-containing protein n=1 Tax=Lottiidibacillus patelloidae TaxID=2670334 RepID=A0A263BV36_9BACI|nr:hypothetical protein [Lottiidibacillus patelloidae]OZM57570.1 hypothetical protein CIB95_04150 [Lottiidibacillus patelloidae]
MKRKCELILISLMMVSFLVGCNDDKSVNDHYVSIQLEETLFNEDYEAFKGMLKEDFQNKEETYKKLKGIVKDSKAAQFTKMEIIEYDNGEMVLVYLTVEDDDIKISDVKVIPEELTETFKGLIKQN